MLSGFGTIRKILLVLAGGLVGIVLLQVLFFTWIWNSDRPLHQADLIIVFPGDKERIVEGYALAREGLADNLLIIGQTAGSLPKLVRQFGDLPDVKMVENGKSRSTFEDVNIAKQIISENRFKSVVLVTSSYHMPRVLFLCKTFLLDTGFKIEMQYSPVEFRDHSKKMRIYYNEMIKFWGSTAEMIGCQVTDRLLRDLPFFAHVAQFVKKRFLFQV